MLNDVATKSWVAGLPLKISYNDLVKTANAADPDGDAISFVIMSVASGSLCENGDAVVPGETVVDFVSVELADLADGVLGEAIGNRILIDRDAAGYGWLGDPVVAGNTDDYLADLASSRRMDLLTAVMHEMGHAIGLSDLDASVDDLMCGRLKVGVRRK